jgi:hypothetical protein
MTIETHHTGDTKTAEVISEEILVSNPEDGLQLIGDLYYQGFDKIILHEKNISPDFFDLKTGIAGEILQKFSNYRVPLVIVGDFSSYGGKSIKDFIFESNNGRQVNFLSDLSTAIKKLSE